MDDVARLAERYRHFAVLEAPRRSLLYAELASGLAEDREMLAWLASLPVGKRQPNLVFASTRAVAGTPDGFPAFRAAWAEHRDEIEALVLARRTQTNEPARCALLLPLLAALPQPLALLEVGASAGLCLLPDRYSYDYAGHQLGPAGAPLMRCRPEGPVPLPTALPEIVWRAGLDLDPIDLADPEQVRWLELLIWPGQEYRLHSLHDAIEVARADPPRMIRGDLRTDLPALAAQAPPDATLVVFHTAVLQYVPSDGRAEFRAAVEALNAVWIACETPRVLGLDEAGPPDMYALARDGRRVAWADGHGASLRWAG